MLYGPCGERSGRQTGRQEGRWTPPLPRAHIQRLLFSPESSPGFTRFNFILKFCFYYTTLMNNLTRFQYGLAQPLMHNKFLILVYWMMDGRSKNQKSNSQWIWGRGSDIFESVGSFFRLNLFLLFSKSSLTPMTKFQYTLRWTEARGEGPQVRQIPGRWETQICRWIWGSVDTGTEKKDAVVGKTGVKYWLELGWIHRSQSFFFFPLTPCSDC